MRMKRPKRFSLYPYYPLCATLPLAHGARIFASLSENPQNSAVEPTSALGIPAYWVKLPNGFCSAFQYVNVLLAAACRLRLKLPCVRLFLPIPPLRRGCIARAPPLSPVSASLVFHTSTRFFPLPEEFPSFLFALAFLGNGLFLFLSASLEVKAPCLPVLPPPIGEMPL